MSPSPSPGVGRYSRLGGLCAEQRGKRERSEGISRMGLLVVFLEDFYQNLREEGERKTESYEGKDSLNAPTWVMHPIRKLHQSPTLNLTHYNPRTISTQAINFILRFSHLLHGLKLIRSWVSLNSNDHDSH